MEGWAQVWVQRWAEGWARRCMATAGLSYPSPVARPVDIAHAPRHNTLTITWDDGISSRLPVPYLRGWCPCAACQGHGRTVQFREPPATVAAAEIHEIGAYAIAIRFSDGHDSGIFSWDWLRQIAPETPPEGFKGGIYRDGAFHPA